MILEVLGEGAVFTGIQKLNGEQACALEEPLTLPIPLQSNEGHVQHRHALQLGSLSVSTQPGCRASVLSSVPPVAAVLKMQSLQTAYCWCTQEHFLHLKSLTSMGCMQNLDMLIANGCLRTLPIR